MFIELNLSILKSALNNYSGLNVGRISVSLPETQGICSGNTHKTLLKIACARKIKFSEVFGKDFRVTIMRTAPLQAQVDPGLGRDKPQIGHFPEMTMSR